MPVTSMGVIEDHAKVNGPIEKVFAFVSDFSTINEWDPGSVSSKKLTEGDVRVGTSWDVVTQFKGKQSLFKFTVAEYNPPNMVQLIGESDIVKTIDTIKFSADPADPQKTIINYKADMTLKGFRKPFIAFLGSDLDKLGRDAMIGLENRLDGTKPF